MCDVSQTLCACSGMPRFNTCGIYDVIVFGLMCFLPFLAVNTITVVCIFQLMHFFKYENTKHISADGRP